MIVSILNQKGGAGKTTLSLNLAHAFTKLDLCTLLIDADPQGSARDWHTHNNGSILNMIALDRPTLEQDINQVKDTFEWIFIDTPSNLIGLPIVTSAIKCADVVLIPIQPSQFDIWSTDSLVNLIKERISSTDGKLKAAFVVMRSIGNTKIGKEIKDVLASYELPIFHHFTQQRIVYITCISEGQTVINHPATKAYNEIMDIANELLRFTK